MSQAAVAAITLFQLRMHLSGSVSWSTLLAKLIASALCFCAATYFLDPSAPVRSLVLAIIAGAATYVTIVTALLAISPSGRQEISFLRTGSKHTTPYKIYRARVRIARVIKINNFRALMKCCRFNLGQMGVRPSNTPTVFAAA